MKKKIDEQYNIEFFDTSIVKTTSIIDKSYKLRHDVYCNELNFEKSENIFETDAYDKKSTGSIISLKSNNQPIACVRLIYPIENKTPCLISISNNFPNEHLKIILNLKNLKFVEVSRLLILKKFRKNNNNNINNYDLILILYATVFVLSKDLDCIIFMCEKKMLSFLKKIGLPFSQLTINGIEHNGVRYPIKIDIKELNLTINSDKKTLKILWNIILFLKNKIN